MSFTEEDLNKAIVEAREAHEKYRASGLGLSALVVTLSGAVAYKVAPENPYTFFVLPIVLALFHQTAHYIGSMYHARCMFYWSAFAASRLIGNEDGMKDNRSKANVEFDTANDFFSFSEYLCISSVLSFCALSLLSISVIQCECRALGLTVILLIIVAICWIFRDADIAKCLRKCRNHPR